MSRNILLVEDNLIAQRIASFVISNCNDKVTVVGTGAEALKLATTQEFNLIILDIGLPDIDGLTVRKRLFELGVNTPVVGLTAHEDLTDVCIYSKPLTRELYQNILAKTAN